MDHMRDAGYARNQRIKESKNSDKYRSKLVFLLDGKVENRAGE